MKTIVHPSPIRPRLPKKSQRKLIEIPDSTGFWFHLPKGKRGTDKNFDLVTIEHGPSSGFFCRTLRQGGSAKLGFGHWSGLFVKAL